MLLLVLKLWCLGRDGYGCDMFYAGLNRGRVACLGTGLLLAPWHLIF